MESIVEILSYVFWVILAITILVFVHELGHFVAARMFKMRVERFSVGFPPKLFGKKIGDTEYVVGATPLGGYVKISGMVDESMDAGYEASEPQPWEFRSKPVWQRIIVITAGVVFNIILAAAIFMGLKLSYGETYIPADNVEAIYVAEGSIAHEMGLRTGDRIVAVNGREPQRYNDFERPDNLLADRMTITAVRGEEELTYEAPSDIMTRFQREGGLGISAAPSVIGTVMVDSPAYEAGLMPGDRIVEINGQAVDFWAQMTARIQEAGADPVDVTWLRAEQGALQGERMRAELTPRHDESEGRFLIGVGFPTEAMIGELLGVRHREFGVGEAFVGGIADTWINTKTIVTSLRRVFTGRDDFRENVGGPIMIAKVTKEAADRGAAFFWSIVALLSITLAIMNILPIPALDGGHLMFLIYEGITRREPSLKVRMAMQQVGMILLLVFMTFVIFNDILRF
jgi:regulator of sigma E protease